MSEQPKRDGTGGESPIPSIEDLLTSSNWEDRLAEARARRERVLAGARSEAPVVRLPRVEDTPAAGPRPGTTDAKASDPAPRPRTSNDGAPGFGPGRTGLGPPSPAGAELDEGAPPNLLSLHGSQRPADGAASAAMAEIVARPTPRRVPAEVPAPPPVPRAAPAPAPIPLVPRWRADAAPSPADPARIATATPPKPRWRGPILGGGLGLCLGLAIGLGFAVGAWYANSDLTDPARPAPGGTEVETVAIATPPPTASPADPQAPLSSAEAPTGPATPAVVEDLPQPGPSARSVPGVGSAPPAAGDPDVAPARPEPAPAVAAAVEPPQPPTSVAVGEGPAVAPLALPGGRGSSIVAVPPEAPTSERDVPVAAADPLPAQEPRPAPSDGVRRTVYIHAPTALPDGAVAEIAAALGAAGFAVSTPIRVGFDVGADHVRFYHAEDAEAARGLARTLDGTARDFTGYRPAPAAGTIEVWLATDR